MIGYALIVTYIIGITLRPRTHTDGQPPVKISRRMPTLLALGSGLFLLVFFTVHFGGFHLGHSVFLNHFFPIDGTHGANGNQGIPSLAMYAEVFRSCWWFLPLAFIAERRAFARMLHTPEDAGTPSPRDAQKDSDKATPTGNSVGNGMFAPYKNVVRLHLLIFFFAFAFALGVQDFWIYLVVYAVYFFPWSVLKKRKISGQTEPS